MGSRPAASLGLGSATAKMIAQKVRMKQIAAVQRLCQHRKRRPDRDRDPIVRSQADNSNAATDNASANTGSATERRIAKTEVMRKTARCV